MTDLTVMQRPFAASSERMEHSLLAQLRDFYRELIRVKYALHAGLKTLAPGVSEDAESDPVIIVHHHLKAQLERRYVGATQAGGIYSAELYREAQYVMAALADETLLYTTEWDGRDRWKDNLLEQDLFATSIAGERIFDNIEALAARGTAANPDLAAVYLVALSLGFRGKYRAIADQSALRHYRRVLRQILDRHAGLRVDHALPMFADAYAHTLDDGKPTRLPHLRPWLIAIAVALLTYLVVAHVIWVRGTAGIEGVLQSPVLHGALLRRELH